MKKQIFYKIIAGAFLSFIIGISLFAPVAKSEPLLNVGGGSGTITPNIANYVPYTNQKHDIFITDKILKSVSNLFYSLTGTNSSNLETTTQYYSTTISSPHATATVNGIFYGFDWNQPKGWKIDPVTKVKTDLDYTGIYTGGLTQITYDSNTLALYGVGQNGIVKITLNDMTASLVVSSSNFAIGSSITNDGEYLYVCSYSTGDVYKYSINEFILKFDVPLGVGALHWIAYDKDTNSLFVTNPTDLIKLDLDLNILNQVTTPLVTITDDQLIYNGRVWLVGEDVNDRYMYNYSTSDLSLEDTILTLRPSYGVYFNTNDGLIYITASDRSRVVVIDPSDNSRTNHGLGDNSDTPTNELLFNGNYMLATAWGKSYVRVFENTFPATTNRPLLSWSAGDATFGTTNTSGSSYVGGSSEVVGDFTTSGSINSTLPSGGSLSVINGTDYSDMFRVDVDSNSINSYVIHNLVSGATTSADIDFNGFKAIAQACDNGATLPNAPNDGQWFLHNTTGRSILMQYKGGSWHSIISYGDTVLYVDGTLGSDDPNNGWGTGADAFQNIMTAVNTVPQLNTGNVTINIASGSYITTGSEYSLVVAGKYFAGYYDFIIQGASIDSVFPTISATSGVTFTAGGASTSPAPAVITTSTNVFSNAGFGTDALRGYFIQYGVGATPSGTFYVITDNTANTVSINENVITSGVTQFKIYPPPTTIVKSNGATPLDYTFSTAFGQTSGTTAGVTFKNIKFDASANAPTIGIGFGSQATVINSHIISANRQNGAQIAGKLALTNSYVYQQYANRYALNIQAGGNLSLSGSLIYVNADGCQAIRVAISGVMNSQTIGSIYGNSGTTTNGLSIVGGSVTLFNQYFKNLNVGVNADVATVLVYQNKSYATFVNVTTPYTKSLQTYNGGITLNYRAVTTTYQILQNDYTIDCTSGTFTTTLPTAISIAGFSGAIYNVKNSGAGTITVSGYSSSIGGSSTTQFDITNPSGTTFRYTYDGTGTNPNIQASTIPVGTWLDIQGQNFNASNKGIFQVTAIGSSYFEITNAGGVAENNKTLGTGYINFDQRIDGNHTYTLGAGAKIQVQSTGVNWIALVT